MADATPKTVMAGLDPAIHVLRLTAIAIVFGITACSSNTTVPLAAVCPESGESYYFPADTGSAWYARALSRMREPSLSCGKQPHLESYRFLWLHTYGSPVAVRIVRSALSVELEAVELSGQGGYEMGTEARRVRRTLSTSEWRQFSEALVESRFWDLPTRIDRIGADGAVWIMEGQRDRSYHTVNRWSPEPGRYVILGQLFMELSGIPFLEAQKPHTSRQ